MSKLQYISRKKAVDKLMFESSLRGLSYTAEAYEMAARIIDNMEGETIFDTNNRLKQIAEHYGMPTQREQLIEECSELILSAQKCKRYGTREDFNNFCGELADVYIMVQQMIYLISPEAIGNIINEKLERQIQRIKDESEPDTAELPEPDTAELPEPDTAELPEPDTEGMQLGDIRTVRNGDAWKSVMKI